MAEEWVKKQEKNDPLYGPTAQKSNGVCPLLNDLI
jgi:hypothetical protein